MEGGLFRETNAIGRSRRSKSMLKRRIEEARTPKTIRRFSQRNLFRERERAKRGPSLRFSNVSQCCRSAVLRFQRSIIDPGIGRIENGILWRTGSRSICRERVSAFSQGKYSFKSMGKRDLDLATQPDLSNEVSAYFRVIAIRRQKRSLSLHFTSHLAIFSIS